jgi:hypothetical protein
MWDDPDSRRTLPLLSFLFVVIGVEMLWVSDWVVGIAAVVVSAAMAINVFYFRAVDAVGTVRPFVLRARWAADAGYFLALVALTAHMWWRVNHPGDLGWFWTVLNLAMALLIGLAAGRFLVVRLSGRRP